MKNELKTVFDMDVNLLNLHIDEARKTHHDQQCYSITHFKPTLFTSDIKCNDTVINSPQQKWPFFL